MREIAFELNILARGGGAASYSRIIISGYGGGRMREFFYCLCTLCVGYFVDCWSL